MKPLESRISALERARDNILPTVRLTFTDGTQADMNALDAFIYAAQLDAGKPDTRPIASTQICGKLPTIGTVWATLETDLENVITTNRREV